MIFTNPIFINPIAEISSNLALVISTPSRVYLIENIFSIYRLEALVTHDIFKHDIEIKKDIVIIFSHRFLLDTISSWKKSIFLSFFKIFYIGWSIKNWSKKISHYCNIENNIMIFSSRVTKALERNRKDHQIIETPTMTKKLKTKEKSEWSCEVY